MNNLKTVITREQAIKLFEACIMPFILGKEKESGRKDMPRRRQMWNDFVDSHNKNGQISEWQAANWSQPAHICER